MPCGLSPQVRELDSPIEPVRLDHRFTRKEAREAKAAAAGGEGEAAADGEPVAEGQADPEAKQEGAAGSGAAEEDVAAAAAQQEVKEVKEEQEAKEEAVVEQETAAAEQQPADAAAAAAEGGAGGDPAGSQPKGWKQRKQEAEAEEPVPEGLPEWGARAVGGGSRNRQVSAAARHPRHDGCTRRRARRSPAHLHPHPDAN